MPARTRPPVRSLRPDERRRAAEVLTRAFWDDPVMEHLIPPGSRRRRQRLDLMYRWTLDDAARRVGAVLTTDDLAAVAAWHAPDQPRPGLSDLVRAIPLGVGSIGVANLAGSIELLKAMQRAHPHEPHWYLQVIGSDPARRGSGAAAALIERVLQRADDDGVAAYLESSKAENVSYYARFGFEVTEELHPVEGAPPLWLMWREPRPPEPR